MRFNYNSIVLVILYVAIFGTPVLAQDTDSETYPTISFDGTLKNKFEYAIDTNHSRFSVRNSRVGIKGDINDFTGYRAQLELSDEGEFKVLDLSGIIYPLENLAFTFGQTGIPLYNSYITTPGEMLFANRAFIGKYFLSTRDLGINAKYNFKMGAVPTKLEFGVYNGNAINDPVWKKNLSYGGRVELGNMEGLRFTTKFFNYLQSDTTHFFVYGADLRYEINRFKIETEVMKKESKTEFHNDLLSYYIQAAYKVPIKSRYFDHFLPAMRWDAIDETPNEEGFDTNRFTVGLGFDLAGDRFNTIIRLDYERYIINRPMTIFAEDNQMDSDKITLELLLTF